MKNNVIIGIEDDYTSIYVWTSFNNQVIPLFFNSLNNQESVVNGSVYNKKKFSEVITTLISQANNFVGEQITEVTLCVHNFNVNIHNFELTIDLKKSQVQDIIDTTRAILKESIAFNGTTIHSFTFSKWKPGSFQDKLQIYDRQECFQCHQPIEFFKLNQRGTYCCKRCQKKY